MRVETASLRDALRAVGRLHAQLSYDDDVVRAIWRSETRDPRRWWKTLPPDLRARAAAGALLVAGEARRDALASALDELERPARRRSPLAERLRRMRCDDVLVAAGLREGRRALAMAARIAEDRAAEAARAARAAEEAADAAALDEIREEVAADAAAARAAGHDALDDRCLCAMCDRAGASRPRWWLEPL
jgi:hypothetical protein